MTKEPILILIAGGTALVQGLLQLAAAFGLHLTSEQVAALTTVAGILLAAYARSHVTPVATLPPGVAAQIADTRNRL